VLADNPKVEEAVIYGSRAKEVHKPGSAIDLVLKGEKLTRQSRRLSRESQSRPDPDPLPVDRRLGQPTGGVEGHAAPGIPGQPGCPQYCLLSFAGGHRGRSRSLYHVTAKRLKKVPEEYAECLALLGEAGIIPLDLCADL
jgi:hypothetical protein